jgi:hypothetical protein
MCTLAGETTRSGEAGAGATVSDTWIETEPPFVLVTGTVAE